MSDASSGFLGLPWWAWGALSLALAVVWCFVWPTDRIGPNTGILRFLLVRWGHAATWFFLAANFFLRAWAPAQSGLANILALAGLAAYLGFMAASILTR